MAGFLVMTWSALAAAEPILEIAGTEAAPISRPTGGLSSNMTSAGDFTLGIACKAPIDCTKLKPTLDQNNVAQPTPKAVTATTTTATYAVPAGSLFVVRYASVATDLFKLTVTATAPVPPPGPPAPTPAAATPAAGTVQQLSRTECQPITLARAPNEVFVTPLGTTLTPLPDRFSESDTLTVTVVGDVHLVDLLQVRRKSTIRTVTGRILGEDQAIPQFSAQAEKALAKNPCTTKSFTVANFAPGAGEVEISASSGTEPVVLGSFQLLVDPTYIGMFSLGAVWTPLVAPSFGVAMRDGQQVIVSSEAGDRRLAYAFLFTPFLWEALDRDVRRPMAASKIYQHLNLSVGFLLNDPVNNVLLGATFDVQSCVLFSGGVLHSHVNELDGVKVGDAFTGSTADLPTHKTWKTDWFIGVSVDVRIAVKLLRTVLGTASGS